MAGTTQASPFKPQSWRLVWEPVHEDNAFFEGDRDTDDNHATTITHGFENRHNLHHDAIPTPEHGILSNITPALYAFTSATTPNPIVPGFSRSSSINTSASLVANNRDQGPSRPPLFQPANRTIPTTRRHQPTLQPPAPQFNTYERFASNPSMDYVAHAENPRQSYSRGPGSTDGSSSGSVSCGSSNISNDDATASPDTAYDGPAGGSFGPSVTNEKDNLGNWLDNGAVPQDQVYLGLGQATNTFSQQDWAQQQPSHLELGSFGGGNRITRMDQPYLWGTQVASAPQPRQFMTPQPRRDLFADPGANGNYITIQNLPLIGNAGVVAGLPGDLAPVTSFGSFDEALSPTANSHPARSLQQQEQQGTPPLMPNSLSPLSTTARNPSTVQSPLHNDRNFNSSALSHRQFNGSLNDTTATDYSKPQNLATNAAGSVIFSQATDYAADEADSFYPFPNYNNSYDSANSYGSVSSYDGSLEKMVEDAMVAACIEAPAAPAAASAPAMVLPAIPYVNHPPPMMSHDDLMPLRDSVGLLTPGSCNDHAIDTGAPKHRIVPLNIDDGENDDNGDNDDNGRALTLIVEHGRKKLARPSVTPAPPRQSQSGRKRGRPPAEPETRKEFFDKDGGLQGLQIVLGANKHQRPKQSAERRAEIKRKKQEGVCPRCKRLKSGCEGYRKSDYLPCDSCRRANPTTITEGCTLNALIESVVFFRTGPPEDPSFPLSFIKGRTDVLNVSDFDGLHRSQNIELELKQLDIGEVLRLTVALYKPKPGDKTAYEYKKDGVSYELDMPPYCIGDLEKARESIFTYVRLARRKYIDCLIDKANRPLWLAFQYALQYEKPLVQRAIDIWAATRLIERTWELCGEETLGIKPIRNKNDPWEGHVPVTPIMDQQLDQVVIREVLKPLQEGLVIEIRKKLFNDKERKDSWFELFLAKFILLNNSEKQIAAEREFADRYGFTGRYGPRGKYKDAEAQFHTARTLLAHFHYMCTGGALLSANDAALERKPMEPNDRAFISLVKKEIKAEGPKYETMLSKAQYEKDLYFGHQMFVGLWHPGPGHIEELE